MMIKMFFSFIFISGWISSFTAADMVTLKSGKVIQGKIIDRYDDVVRIQLEDDMILTFYKDEIKDFKDVEEESNQEEVVIDEAVLEDSEKDTDVEAHEVVDLSEEKDSVQQDEDDPVYVATMMVGPRGGKKVLDSTLNRIHKMEQKQLNRPDDIMRKIQNNDY